jgi:hypothetical protein
MPWISILRLTFARSSMRIRNSFTVFVRTTEGIRGWQLMAKVSISEAARLVNVSRPTLYKMLNNGTLTPRL